MTRYSKPGITQNRTVGRLIVAVLLLVIPVQTAYSQTAEERGLEIAREMDARDTGWRDMTSNMTMLLRNKRGDESKREMRLKSLEVSGDGDKSLTTFDTPKDVKGTSFLSHTHVVGADDQWLYLPALKRVKRISSNNKSGPFMGSEFAYEDLTSQEVDKYTYKYIRDDTANGKQVFVVERYPVDKKSGYTKQVAYVDQEEYIPVRIVYYDRKGSLLKTLQFSDYHLYKDQYWRAHTMEMKNVQTGKSTVLTWTDITFGNDLSDRDFDRTSLKRAR